MYDQHARRVVLEVCRAWDLRFLISYLPTDPAAEVIPEGVAIGSVVY